MRTNMDPLTPATSILAPAISHIAETAAALSSSLSNQTAVDTAGKDGATVKQEKDERMEKERQTARWVLDAPRRLGVLIRKGKKEAAEAEWDEVRRLLDRWKDVKGVEEVRAQCGEALKGEGGSKSRHSLLAKLSLGDQYDMLQRGGTSRSSASLGQQGFRGTQDAVMALEPLLSRQMNGYDGYRNARSGLAAAVTVRTGCLQVPARSTRVTCK